MRMKFLVDPPITMQFLFDPFRLGGGRGEGGGQTELEIVVELGNLGSQKQIGSAESF